VTKDGERFNFKEFLAAHQTVYPPDLCYTWKAPDLALCAAAESMREEAWDLWRKGTVIHDRARDIWRRGSVTREEAWRAAGATPPYPAGTCRVLAVWTFAMREGPARYFRECLRRRERPYTRDREAIAFEILARFSLSCCRPPPPGPGGGEPLPAPTSSVATPRRRTA
jgi:hypothetical protein